MEKGRASGIIPGIILIALGILFFLKNYRINMGDWFILGVGIIFIIAYFTKKKTGFLITGLILSYMGGLIFFRNIGIIDERISKSWILIGLGLVFLTAYFIRKKKGFIFPGFILIGIGSYYFIIRMQNVYNNELWPLFFMILSIAFLLIFIFEFKTYRFNPLIFSIISFLIGLFGFMVKKGIINEEIWRYSSEMLSEFWPAILILGGVIVILRNTARR